MRYFQSLEPRPRSIYDALDRSTNNTVPGQSRAKPTNKVPQNKVSFIFKPIYFYCIYVYICFTLILNNCIWHHHPSTGGSDCSDPARRWVCLWELLIHKALYKPFKYIWRLTSHCQCLTKIFIRLSVRPSIHPFIFCWLLRNRDYGQMLVESIPEATGRQKGIHYGFIF